MHRRSWLPVLLVTVSLPISAAVADAQDGSATGAVDIRAAGGLRIIAVHQPAAFSPQLSPLNAARSLMTASGEQILPAATTSTPYPRPPLAGFSPLVAMTTSDKHRPGSDAFEHMLETSYQGVALNPPADENIVVGIYDSGSSVDMVFAPFDATLGLVGSYVTDKSLEIGGIGGTADAFQTEPVGLFIASLSDIDPATGLLNLTQVVGHSNDAMLVGPEINCGEAGGLTAIVSTSLLSFYNTIIRVDTPVRRVVGTDTYLSPDLEILDKAAALPVYPRKITMTLGAYDLVTTSSYLWFDLLGEVLYSPTMLASSDFAFPTGGGFFASVGVIEGEPSPTNPLQTMRVLVDTGSQSSIITPAMAANLSLNLATPDFTVDACGVGGLVTGIPGFWVDYVKINASGGAMEFSQAPFVVADLASPDGGTMDGVLGMNFFWNRNVIFQPALYGEGSGFLHVSDPIPFAYGDFDRDLDVDQDDFAIFSSCSSGPGVPLRADCTQVDADDDGDVDQVDFGFFQVCLSGENVTADVNCKP